MTAEKYQVAPVAFVRSTRESPRDDDWDAEAASIVLSEELPEEALYGLADFSHVEVIYIFDRVALEKIETGARRPRGNPDWPAVGIFAQRGKNRPNRIGLATCEILSVQGREIQVRGLDAIDGTPVIDLKPVMAEFQARGTHRQPEWAGELMRGYWASDA